MDKKGFAYSTKPLTFNVICWPSLNVTLIELLIDIPCLPFGLYQISTIPDSPGQMALDVAFTVKAELVLVTF